MTYIRNEINERLVKPNDQWNLEEMYELGDWEYECQGVDCDYTDVDDDTTLYKKYCCTEYGEFKQNGRYKELHELLCAYIRAAIRPNRQNVIDMLEIYLNQQVPNPKISDISLHNHLERRYKPAEGDPTDVYDEAGDIWVRYILERGPKLDD